MAEFRRGIHGFREIQKMQSKKLLGILILSALVLITVLAFIDKVLSKAENSGLSKVVFYVS